MLTVMKIILYKSATLSKNAVSTKKQTKQSSYFDIKCAISDEFSLMAKGCMNIMFDIVDTAFSY